MNRDYLADFGQLRNTVPDREMSFRSAIDKAIDLGKSESVHDLLKFCAPIGTNDQNHLVDIVALFEPVDRMSNDRLVADEAQQFIKSHSLTAASRYDYGRDHEESCQCQLSVSVSCQLPGELPVSVVSVS